MTNSLVLVVFSVIVSVSNIDFVQCSDQCKVHADCNRNGSVLPLYCCGGLIGNKIRDRNCTYSSCLNHYCSTDSDCGNSTMCCRSEMCVNKGCSGCRQNTDCDIRHVCCKKTFSFDQTVCAVNCLNKTCNFNDDCARHGECCRSGRCVNKGCYGRCKSNSECNSSQYCCKKKTSSYGKDSCSQSCVGETCSTNEDCGARNECCIANKCVDRGCSGCTSNSDCNKGQYCCKKIHSYELSECSTHCIRKFCNTSDDCGGPAETCDDHRCEKVQILPTWAVAVIKASLVVLLIFVGVLIVLFCYRKRKRSTDTTRAESVPLQSQEIETQQNRRSNV